MSALPSCRLWLMHRRQILECTRKRYAQCGWLLERFLQGISAISASDTPIRALEWTPWVRQQNRGRFLEQSPAGGFRQFPPGFRRFAPSSERAPFPMDSRFPPFPPFPPVVLLSRPRGGLQQNGTDGAARAEFAGAADVLGFAAGGRP